MNKTFGVPQRDVKARSEFIKPATAVVDLHANKLLTRKSLTQVKRPDVISQLLLVISPH